jgi:hypothetical protein
MPKKSNIDPVSGIDFDAHARGVQFLRRQAQANPKAPESIFFFTFERAMREIAKHANIVSMAHGVTR